MEALSLQYPVWYVILCVMAGVCYALFMYYRDTTFRDHPAWVRWLMSALRFLTVSLVSMLLLSPFLKLNKESVQQPVVVIGQDNSSSLMDGMSSEDSASYMAALNALAGELSEKYDVQLLAFGESTRSEDTMDFKDQVTDIAEFLDYTNDQYSDQNLGAVIIASDGLFNRGKNPLYIPKKSAAQVFAIALGDTTIKTDVRISQVLHNQIAFLGDQFPVQIDIAADRLTGSNATLRIERIDGNQRSTIDERVVRIDRESYFQTEEVLLDASQPGVMRYRASISGIGNEALYANNTKDFYIEVIDGRVKILILANSPHPDLAAVRSVLEEHKNYTCDVRIFREFTGQVRDYDLIVFHQLPSGAHDIAPILAQLDAQQKPRLFIVGNQTMLGRFNQAQSFLQIQASQQAVNEVTAIVEPGFKLFTVPEDLTQQIARFAPLRAPFGQYNVDPAAQVYLWQQVGRVETQFPLLMFGESSGVKTGILAGEGFWRWRLYDYMQHGTHELTHTLMAKTIQYLSVKEDKRRFRAAPVKNLFKDHEVIDFTAEVYNLSYEQVTDPDVFLEVRDTDGNSYHYTFSKTDYAYILSLGKYPVGEYSFTAYSDFDGSRHQVNGKFSVQKTELESYVTTADHNLLESLSGQYGGRVFYPDEMDVLMDTLLNSDHIKPVIYLSTLNQPLIHMRWIFFVFLFLLGLEWFIRRYLGGY